MKTLYTVNEAAELIKTGKPMMVAGSEDLLKKLPRGRWIAGTIPYFMSEDGGVLTHDKVNVTELPEFVTEVRVQAYGKSELAKIPKDYFANGVSFVVIPGFSEVLQTYAQECSTWPGVFDRPLAGWVSGFDLKQAGQVGPKVMNGMTGEFEVNKALVMHLNLPKGKVGRINIINLFKQGRGDTISFLKTGFEMTDALINGQRKNFVDYLNEKKIDTKLPLVADYMGAMINVSIQNVDQASKKVQFYAPVFPDVEYKIAIPVGDYEKEFNKELQKATIRPAFSCNCILNYLYANLEGKKTGDVTGPITFGEIAYMLLNQTMVYVSIDGSPVE